MVRIATVFGATGTSGSSVVHALLKDGIFKPRAVTRNANSESARKQAALGCEIAEAELADKEAVKRAVTGAECVFLVTIPFTAVSEVIQGTNVVDASKEAGVQFVVLSTLPHMSNLSHGKYSGSHWDDKAIIQKHLMASGLAHAGVGTGHFLENLSEKMAFGPLAGRYPLEKTDDGLVLHSFAKPEATYVQSWISRDMGPSVAALMANYASHLDEINGKTFVVATELSSQKDFAEHLSKGLGQPVQFDYVGSTGLEAVDNMFAFCVEFETYPGIEVPDRRLEKFGVKMGTVEEFARSVLLPRFA
ncbi:NAD(P)-binding protein [Schizophyllum commune H4-8]|uniref:NmrA-like domain-containing protein n=1 Tax=Schizophyllum commune (strain H4-8 / FGSC 9210) TaxID=578458 RepID=D8PW43_SCHCM|nr:NAD(P)-binding protein [Schizophyllum commune H4-8]KAI5900098.1 NAD(P)-binding protein [Schizophyllum commune H4-8]